MEDNYLTMFSFEGRKKYANNIGEWENGNHDELIRVFKKFISYAENNGVCDQTSYGDFVRLLYEHSSRKIYS